MSPYDTSEYQGFLRAMREQPDDRNTPLVCADWLEENGKTAHAQFIRGCCRVAYLRDVLDECLKQDLHYTDPARACPAKELDSLVNDLRPYINRHLHEWTRGAIRKHGNPTLYDWKHGFLWNYATYPFVPGSDRIRDQRLHRKLESILSRQPICSVTLLFPVGSPLSPLELAQRLGNNYPGVKFHIW